ncbi:MAG: twin-arginine translocase subunit TatC [Saprospiraceae bacterium]
MQFIRIDLHQTRAASDLYTRALGESDDSPAGKFFRRPVSRITLVFWEIWKFVSPGLYENERKATKGIVFVLSTLFIIGVLFGFFVLAPFSISFLSSYTVSDLVQSSATLSSIVDVMVMFTFFTGLVFELPLAVFFLPNLAFSDLNLCAHTEGMHLSFLLS